MSTLLHQWWFCCAYLFVLSWQMSMHRMIEEIVFSLFFQASCLYSIRCVLYTESKSLENVSENARYKSTSIFDTSTVNSDRWVDINSHFQVFSTRSMVYKSVITAWWVLSIYHRSYTCEWCNYDEKRHFHTSQYCFPVLFVSILNSK
jgi:hypothetical protein